MPSSPIARAALVFAIGMTLLAIGMAVWRWNEQQPQPAAVSGETSGSGTALIGGAFELVDQNGETRTAADFRGQFMLIYFGYTYCPDVCPTSLSIMTQALDLLEAEAPEAADRIAPLFITIDPERDTVPVMRSYAEHFHPDMVALTGSAEQIAQAAEAYRVYYAKADDSASSDYLMDHSGFIYLMGPEGDYVAHFAHNATAKEIAESLKEHAG